MAGDGNSLSILRVEAGWLAVAKPAGLSVHEAPGPGKSVLRLLREEQGLDGLLPVHRLDKGASGVLILARNKELARQFQQHWPLARKEYLGLCVGVPQPPEGQVSAPLLEHSTGKPERLAGALRYYAQQHPQEPIPPPPPPKTTAVHPAGRPAVTEYRTLETFSVPAGNFSWLEIRPQQGRMHQIRVHVAYLGCPLCGDELYGGAHRTESNVAGRLALHAHQLTLPACEGAWEAIQLTAPVADDLQTALDALRKVAVGPTQAQ